MPASDTSHVLNRIDNLMVGHFLYRGIGCTQDKTKHGKANNKKTIKFSFTCQSVPALSTKTDRVNRSRG